MDKITISDGVSTITMPRVKAVTVGDEEVCKKMTMASGKQKKKMIGMRPVVTAEWDYVPASSMAALMVMLRQGGFFSVGYPDPDGTDKSGSFEIQMPRPKIFKFVNGTAMWHGVSLTMTAQEVV